MSVSCAVVGRVPVRRRSENWQNHARHAAPFQDRVRQARNVLRRSIHGLSLRFRPAHPLRFEVGGSANVNAEEREEENNEHQRQFRVDPNTTHDRHEAHYLEVVSLRHHYHSTGRSTNQCDFHEDSVGRRCWSCGWGRGRSCSWGRHWSHSRYIIVERNYTHCVTSLMDQTTPKSFPVLHHQQ